MDADGGNDFFFFECWAILAVFLTSPTYLLTCIGKSRFDQEHVVS